MNIDFKVEIKFFKILFDYICMCELKYCFKLFLKIRIRFIEVW